MDRKELVKSLSEHLGIKAKYLGVPSFAYQIGDFTISREGKILNKAGDEVKLDEIIKPDPLTEEVMEIERVEIVLPLEGHSLGSLKTLINMVSSKQVLIKNSFRLDKTLIEEEVTEKLNTAEDLNEFKEDLTSENIKMDNENISFILNTDLARTASIFFGLLNEKSKELRYASPKPTITDNEKYAFRTWLMRLGMVGNEYKEARKELLENLSGNSAFRNGPPANKEDANQ